jgi:hypothetical protein
MMVRMLMLFGGTFCFICGIFWLAAVIMDIRILYQRGEGFLFNKLIIILPALLISLGVALVFN